MPTVLPGTVEGAGGGVSFTDFMLHSRSLQPYPQRRILSDMDTETGGSTTVRTSALKETRARFQMGEYVSPRYARKGV